MAAFTLSSNPFPPLPNVHRGTGNISGSAHVMDPATLGGDATAPMGVKYEPFSIQVLSLETGSNDAPNWFGVSFRRGITAFDTVHIFCHPHPGNAHMTDPHYNSRAGNWPQLFRYAEIFGRQIAIAKTNHITIVPFFNNASYGSLGIFADHWLDLVEQILVHVRNAASGAVVPPTGSGRAPNVPVTDINPLGTMSASQKKGGPPAPPRTSSNLLRNVVLSGFSRGRVLAGLVRSRAKGIAPFLREVWDFDGVGGAVPSASRVITYDKQRLPTNHGDHYHVPPARWLEYHHAVLPDKAIHGDIPALMACHAATISRVGH
jgi:hypothetical protein